MVACCLILSLGGYSQNIPLTSVGNREPLRFTFPLTILLAKSGDALMITPVRGGRWPSIQAGRRTGRDARSFVGAQARAVRDQSSALAFDEVQRAERADWRSVYYAAYGCTRYF